MWNFPNATAVPGAGTPLADPTAGIGDTQALGGPAKNPFMRMPPMPPKIASYQMPQMPAMVPDEDEQNQRMRMMAMALRGGM